MKHSAWRAAGALLVSLGSTMASAGPVTSLDTADRAARAAFTANNYVRDLPAYVESLEGHARNFSDKALRLLNSSTTFQALRAARNGVVVACPLSGTLTAKLSRTLPWVLKLEWADCASDWIAGTLTMNGPGELLLLEPSLAPAYLGGIRMGDGQRDHVTIYRPTPPANYYHEYRNNLRMLGLLPNAREGEDSYFPGRASYEITGFDDYILFSPDRAAGQPPSTQLYPHHSLVSADHLFLTFDKITTGTIPTGDREYSTETRIYWGRIDTLNRRDPTPLHPTPIYSQEWLRAWDLRIFSLDSSQLLRPNYREIDGKFEARISEDWGLGCAGSETYRIRTRAPLTVSPDIPFGMLYESGELAINDATVRFSGLGEPPTTMRMAIDAPAAGQFTYDLPDWGLDMRTLATASKCPP